jgi:hypothetical protein
MDSSNPDSNLNANFAGERDDSNPKILIQTFSKIRQILLDLIYVCLFQPNFGLNKYEQDPLHIIPHPCQFLLPQYT